MGEIIQYMSGPSLDWALINTRPVAEEIQEVYRGEAAHPVEGDLEEVQRHVLGVFAACLANNQVPLKHEPERIAEAVLSITSIGRVQRTLTDGNGLHASPALPGLPAALGHQPREE